MPSDTNELARIAALCEQERDTSRAEHKADLRVMADLEDDRNALRGQLDKAEARVEQERERALRWSWEHPADRYEVSGDLVPHTAAQDIFREQYVARGQAALEKGEG